MKRSPIRKIGRKTKEWMLAKARLKKEYQERGITSCEVMLDGCTGNMFLSFAHLEKRSSGQAQHTFEGTILACVACHQKIEYNRDLTKEVFNKLRP